MWKLYFVVRGNFANKLYTKDYASNREKGKFCFIIKTLTLQNMNLTCFIISCNIHTWFCHGNSLLIKFIQMRSTMLWSGLSMHTSKNFVKKLKTNLQNQSVSKQ